MDFESDDGFRCRAGSLTPPNLRKSFPLFSRMNADDCRESASICVIRDKVFSSQGGLGDPALNQT